LEPAAACARVRRLPKDMRIFNQGDDSGCARAIIEGGVRIAQSGSDSAQVVIRFIDPADSASLWSRRGLPNPRLHRADLSFRWPLARTTSATSAIA
jgi:hypothetical protein